MNTQEIKIGRVLLVVCFIAFVNWSNAMPQSSANYIIKKSVIDQSGAASQSTSHKMIDVVGQPTPVGEATSTSGRLSAGFLGGVLAPPVAVEEADDPVIPAEFKLHQNFPNPFNPETAIEYELAKSGLIRLEIYNLLGQKIRILVDQNQSAGLHRIFWNGKNEAGAPMVSGVYLCRMETENFKATIRMVLLR